MTIKLNTILVVDDDPYVLESISTLLRAFGFTVNTCDNANSAIHEIQRTTVDVVLTDIKMPVLTGVDLLTSPDHLAKARAEFDKRRGGTVYKFMLGDRKPPLDYRK